MWVCQKNMWGEEASGYASEGVSRFGKMGLCHLITERLEAASSYSVRDVCGPASADSDESGADGKLLFRGCWFVF